MPSCLLGLYFGMCEFDVVLLKFTDCLQSTYLQLRGAADPVPVLYPSS